MDALVIDTAHGHSRNVIEVARQLRKKCKGVDLVVGNIATAEAAVALAEAGVDAVRSVSDRGPSVRRGSWPVSGCRS